MIGIIHKLFQLLFAKYKYLMLKFEVGNNINEIKD